MKRTIRSFIACASIACTSMLWMTSSVWAAGAYSWDVQPGPDGTMRVVTSNGTFIVDIEGNHGWVGTEEEYERRRIAGNLKGLGYHELAIKGQSENEHQIVSDSLPQISVGASRLADISTMIYFDATADTKLHRPSKSADSEYVGAVWVQSDRVETQAKIIDRESRKTYSPYYCHDVAGNMRTCEFLIPRESLSHQSALLFAGPRGLPVVIPRSSLAREHDKVLLTKYKPSVGSRFALEDDDAITLKSLHELDGSIATSLPPLPRGVTEIKVRERHKGKGCQDDELVVTQAQFDAITVGESRDQVECIFGLSSHSISYLKPPESDDYWKMQRGGYAVIIFSRTEPEIVTAKEIARSFVDQKW